MSRASAVIIGLLLGARVALAADSAPQSSSDAAAAEAAATPAATPGLRPIGAVLEEYVRVAERDNLTLANQRLDAERGQESLRAAQARLWPEVSVNSRYTVNSGGRQIALPVDQLLNPAYQTLNELLVGMGQPARFSLLPEVSFPLLRKHEQDTHLALRQPLYAPAVRAGIEASRAGAEAQQLGTEALLRTQRRDVVRAYLLTQKARAAASIVAGSVTILEENLRINDALYRSGKLTQDAVLRARAELLGATQQRIDADRARQQAERALNLLLDRPLDSAVEAGDPGDDAAVAALAAQRLEAAEALVQRARRTRPEVQQLQRAADSAAAELRAAESQRRPTLALGVDAGIQGEDFGTGPRYNYLSGSLLLSWTVFDGGARRASIGVARLAERAARNQQALGEQRIEMEARAALDAARSSQEALAAAQARAEAARAAFRIASRKRDEGAATQIEFLDARNALTSAELNLAWTRLDVLERREDLDYAAGTTAVSAASTGETR